MSFQYQSRLMLPTLNELRKLTIVAVNVRFEDDHETWLVEFVKPPPTAPAPPRQTRYVCF